MNITCLVENSAKRSSDLWAEHGLSFLIEAGGQRVLFDTGQSGAVLRHNADALGLDLGTIDALVFSHAHYDHTGGLAALLEVTGTALPIYANADLFRPRYSERDGVMHEIGLRELPGTGAAVCLSADPVQVIPGVWTTGVITARPSFEGRSAHHYAADDAGEPIPDPYRDDLSLVLETEKGLVVVCGCCHAGLLNTLAHVKRHFEGEIIAVLGGTHLAAATDADLAGAVAALRDEYNSPRLYPNHCTGERAFVALAAAFGDRVAAFPAGSVLAV